MKLKSGNLILLIILLLMISNISFAEEHKIIKSEKYNYTIIIEGNENKEIDFELLKEVLDAIYNDFEKTGIKLFEDGMGFYINEQKTNSTVAVSTPYSIIYYSPQKINIDFDILYNATLHEIGHTISYTKMDREDWKEYQKLRKINFEDYQKINKREEKKGKYTETQIDYLLCSQENFAEDFRYIFTNKNVKKLKQQTLWGEIKKHKNKKEIEKFLISVLKNDKNFDMFEDEECVYGRYNPLALTLNNKEVK